MLLARLATRQHGVVTRTQLLSIGYSRGEILTRLATGSLHQRHRGTYSVGLPALSQHGRWLAAVLAAGPSAVLSHRDALALWGVADYRRSEIEVTVPGLGSRVRPGIRIHRTRRLDPADRAYLRGVPVTSLERALLDVAGSISPRHLRDAYLEGERRDLIDIGQIGRLLRSAGPRRGAGRLRRIATQDMTQLRRTKSPLEVRFFDFCQEMGFPEPESNYWVHGYEVDAYWPKAKLAVELDSYEFHRGRKAFERDRARIGDLKLFGIEVLPVTDTRLKQDRAKLAAVISGALDRAS